MLSLGALLASAVVICSAGESTDTDDLEQRLVQLVNLERKARALSLLQLSPALSDVARGHSRAMADTTDVSHEAGGTRLEERIDNAAPDWCRAGENIALHFSIESAMRDWLASPGHRDNLLDPRFTSLGVGIVRGEFGSLYITQNFAAMCKKGPP